MDTEEAEAAWVMVTEKSVARVYMDKPEAGIRKSTYGYNKIGDKDTTYHHIFRQDKMVTVIVSTNPLPQVKQ